MLFVFEAARNGPPFFDPLLINGRTGNPQPSPPCSLITVRASLSSRSPANFECRKWSTYASYCTQLKNRSDPSSSKDFSASCSFDVLRKLRGNTSRTLLVATHCFRLSSAFAPNVFRQKREPPSKTRRFFAPTAGGRCLADRHSRARS